MSYPIATAGLRVMVVEDEMMVSLLIEDLLSDQLCSVVGPFDQVAPALQAAQTETIDCAILDVNVSGEKVYPVAEALSARRIPFFFLSGYGRNAVPPDRPNWSVCAKPFTGEHLVTMLLQKVKSAS